MVSLNGLTLTPFQFHVSQMVMDVDADRAYGAGMSKYPWSEWTNGDVWAVDYPVATVTNSEPAADVALLKNNLKAWAKRKGLNVRVHEQILDLSESSGGRPDPANLRKRVRFEFKAAGTPSEEFALEDGRTRRSRAVPFYVRCCPTHGVPLMGPGCVLCLEGAP